MLAGENFVASAVFVGSGGAGAPTLTRSFRCTVARTAAGVFTVTTDDDTTEADTDVSVSASPNGNVSAALVPFVSWRRTAANTYEISVSIAVAVAADPAIGTIIRFGLRRVDTV